MYIQVYGHKIMLAFNHGYCMRRLLISNQANQSHHASPTKTPSTVRTANTKTNVAHFATAESKPNDIAPDLAADLGWDVEQCGVEYIKLSSKTRLIDDEVTGT
jgi:hypothetical protein